MASKRWMSNLAIAGLVADGVYWVLQIVQRSGQPGNYYEYRNSAEGFVYPIQGVITWSAIVVVEILVAAWLLRRTKTVPSMCLVLGLLYGIQVLALGVAAMHAPPYFGGFLIASLFGGCWLIVAWIVTALGSLVREK